MDIVAKVQLRDVRALMGTFSEDRYYLSDQAMREAFLNRGQFNIIDSMSGYKADIIIPGNSPLDEQRFPCGAVAAIRRGP